MYMGTRKVPFSQMHLQFDHGVPRGLPMLGGKKTVGTNSPRMTRFNIQEFARPGLAQGYTDSESDLT